MAGLREELLFEAVAAEDEDTIRTLARRGADLDSHDALHNYGATPLIAAVRGRHAKVRLEAVR